MDDLYVKMCKEAEEIQELWEQSSLHLVITTVDYDFGNYNAYYPLTYETWKAFGKEDLIWLPRQEDLQKICIDKLKGTGYFSFENRDSTFNSHYDWYLYQKVEDWVQLPTNSRNIQFIGTFLSDLTKIWLGFTMYVLSNKTWNFKKETWESI